MGNEQNNKKDKSRKDMQEEDVKKEKEKKELDKKNNNFYMHIQFVGEDLTNFYENLIASKNLICIKDYWIFEKIEENLPIIEQINNYFSFLENQKLSKKRNEKETLIIKVKNISSQEINLFLEKMNNLEQIYYMPLVLILYEEEEEKNIETGNYENIDSRLIKIEKFSEDLNFIEETISIILLRFCSIHNELGDKFSIEGKESFDLTNKNFAFNLNIACIGRTGQGKSAGVNVLLKEYKSKEGNKGGSETKSVKFYQVEDQPIRILDVPGYENDDTIRQSLEKFKESREEINRLKDRIHIILYFLNGLEERTFYKLEYLILDEILEHKSSKIIYVITHSSPNITDRNKKNIIEKINSGIEICLEQKEQNSEILENNKNKYELLYASLDNVVFVNFHKDELNGDKFGDKDLFNKIKDFFIKSDDYKHFSELNIEEEAQRLKAEAKATLLSNKIWGSAVGLIPLVDKVILKFIIKKNALKKVGGIFGIDIKFVNEGYDKEYFNFFNNGKDPSPGVIGVIGSLTSETASIGVKVVGIGVGVVACAIGVGFNGYYTNKFCNKILDEFEYFYKNNGEKLKNSYEDAVNYFSG